jgi:hypothetical protein
LVFHSASQDADLAQAREGLSAGLRNEYIWLDWKSCNQCDAVSESILLWDFFRSLAVDIKKETAVDLQLTPAFFLPR